jgi:hypothetical protein
MAFKMKGAPYPTNRKGKINPNSEGNTDLKDGRSKSAPFQNYENPQDYKVFNMGNKPTPVKQTEDKTESYFMKNVRELGLTKLLKEEGENLGTKVKGSYTDKEQAAIDELNRRMREFEDNPK